MSYFHLDFFNERDFGSNDLEWIVLKAKHEWLLLDFGCELKAAINATFLTVKFFVFIEILLLVPIWGFISQKYTSKIQNNFPLLHSETISWSWLQVWTKIVFLSLKYYRDILRIIVFEGPLSFSKKIPKRLILMKNVQNMLQSLSS